MSIRIMSDVWANSKQKGSALLLLLAVADNAADDGYCWPGIKYLAKKIRMSNRSVMRLVKRIEDDGELFVVRGNYNNRYVVRIGMSTEDLHAVLKAHSIPIPDPLGDKLSRDTGDIPGDTCVTSEVTQQCHPNHLESSMNQDQTPSGDFPTPTPPEPFPTDSNFDPSDTPVSDPDHSVMDHDDPISLGLHCKDRRDILLSGAPDWAVDASGVHPCYPLVVAFCEMTGQDVTRVTAKKGRGWLTKYRAIAIDEDVKPSQLLQAHEFLPDIDRGDWYIRNHKWSTPFQKSYIDQLVMACEHVRMDLAVPAAILATDLTTTPEWMA